MIKKHKKAIKILFVICVVIIFMPSALKKYFMLIPLKMKMNTAGKVSLQVNERKDGKTYVYFDTELVYKETDYKIISLVEEYMEKHPKSFLNNARIRIDYLSGGGGSYAFFYNYDYKGVYNYFVAMSTNTDLELKDLFKKFPNLKKMECYCHYEDIDAFRYLNNPAKIVCMQSSDKEIKEIKKELNKIFPKCEIVGEDRELYELAYWVHYENFDFVEALETIKNDKKEIKILLVICAFVVLIPSALKKYFMLIPLKMKMNTVGKVSLQVSERKDGKTYVYFKSKLAQTADDYKKTVDFVEEYMEKHPKSFLKNARIKISFESSGLYMIFINYDFEGIYNHFIGMSTNYYAGYTEFKDMIKNFSNFKLLDCYYPGEDIESFRCLDNPKIIYLDTPSIKIKEELKRIFPNCDIVEDNHKMYELIYWTSL